MSLPVDLGSSILDPGDATLLERFEQALSIAIGKELSDAIYTADAAICDYFYLRDFSCLSGINKESFLTSCLNGMYKGH